MRQTQSPEGQLEKKSISSIFSPIDLQGFESASYVEIFTRHNRERNLKGGESVERIVEKIG